MAEARLAEFVKDHRKRLANVGGENSAKMIFDQAAKIHLQNFDDNLRLKPLTRDYWRQRNPAYTYDSCFDFSVHDLRPRTLSQ